MTDTTTTIEKPKAVEPKKFPFHMGADPEFLLFNGTRGLDAQGLMRTFFQKNTGLVPKSQGYQLPTFGEIGWDGAASTGELRPDPSDDPLKLTNNLRQLIACLGTSIPFVDFTTLSIGSPIGGHIHLDMPSHLIGVASGNEYVGPNSKEKKEMARIEKLISTFIMPLFASDNRISANGRVNGGSYGRADDFRYQTLPNGKLTIELRGISAEWLSTPKTAYATLSYIGVVWNEILKKNNDLITEKAVLKTKKHIDSIQTMMLSDYKYIEEAVVKGIGKMVKGFELYQDYKAQIDFILNPDAVMKEKERNGWNLNTGWQLGKNWKTPTKKELLNEKAITESLKNADQAAISQGFLVPYNDDYNMPFMAKAISDRIASLNWKLGNEYFLFGLKKGIDGYAAFHCKEEKFYAVPKNSPIERTTESSKKMSNRFKEILRSDIRIDPKNGKVRIWGNNQIIIGIPYDVRVENNVKGLINLIHDIERGTLKTKNASEFEVIISPETNINETDGALENHRNPRHADNTLNSLSSEMSNTIREMAAAPAGQAPVNPLAELVEEVVMMENIQPFGQPPTAFIYDSNEDDDDDDDDDDGEDN